MALSATVNNTNVSGKYTESFFTVGAYRLLKCIDERAVYKILELKDYKPSVISKKTIIKTNRKVLTHSLPAI